MEIATGLFSLGGVLLGGLLNPLTQIFLERKRERRTADRAKLLVAAELLRAQLILRSVSDGERWPIFDDPAAYLPTSAWRENQSSIAGMVSEDLFCSLVTAYTLLEHDRARFEQMRTLPPGRPLAAEDAKVIKESSYELGRLRSRLGIASGWSDEADETARLRTEALRRRRPVPSPSDPQSFTAAGAKDDKEKPTGLRSARVQQRRTNPFTWLLAKVTYSCIRCNAVQKIPLRRVHAFERAHRLTEGQPVLIACSQCNDGLQCPSPYRSHTGHRITVDPKNPPESSFLHVQSL